MYVVYTVFYHYFFRCPSYAQIPTSCHMEADPNDPCCRKPVCHYDPITGHTYIPIPAFAPAVTGKGVVEPPTSSDLLNNTQYTATVALFQTGFTPVPPTVQSNITGGIGRSRWRIVGKIAIFFFPDMKLDRWHLCICIHRLLCVQGKTIHTVAEVGRWVFIHLCVRGFQDWKIQMFWKVSLYIYNNFCFDVDICLINISFAGSFVYWALLYMYYVVSNFS